MNTNEPTDWNEVHRHIETVRSAIDQGFTLSPDANRQILQQRARALAREPLVAEAASEWLEAVEFELGGEHYALPLAQVQTVCLLKELTLVPCCPPFVLGIMNLRGEIRTVIDLRKFFDLPDHGITELNKIIIIEQGEMQLGILADAICGMRRIRLGDLDAALPTLTGICAEHLRGVTSDRLVVLDAAKLLTDHRLLVDEEVPA